MARWLQYRYCYCYLSWPLSYFISSLRFCQFLAANRYKNSPLLVMKDIKMQTRLWALWAGFFPFAAFAAYHWPQRNKTLGSKRMKERTWVTNDRSVLPFEEVRETLTGFAIKFSFIPLPIPWEIAVQIFAFLWDNEVALVSMEDIQLYRELIFFFYWAYRYKDDGGANDHSHLHVSVSHMCSAWGTVLSPDKTHVTPDLMES